MKFDIYDETSEHWARSEDNKNIWQHTPSGKWVFVNEVEQFVGPFETEDAAKIALREYAEAL